MQHLISVTVENRFGVLARISGLFAGRGYNIGSLAVNATENLDVSTIILTVTGDDKVIEQVIKQLNRLIDVIKVVDLTEKENVSRELMLIKVSAEPAGRRSEIFQLCEVFRTKVVGITQKNLIIELTGAASKIEAFIEIMRPYGIIELVRTGIIAIARN
ncbi:MAG TPA: acetolactate synthase small subunit [bacterium]|nr:acetolactate synthase small subunit [bacterium]HPN29946.1 acetolactate synthase small subunit [bacterium]